MDSIREPRVAGTFYPADKKDLLQILKSFNFNEYIETFENISCIIAPHAGYIYSGRIAAAAYQAIQGKQYNTVIVISPSHHEYFSGCSTILKNYSTPLGEISTDTDFTKQLNDQSGIISISELGHGKEHALEVQLPFLQMSLTNFQLVPIIMGRQNMETAQILAEDIYEVIKSGFTSKKFLIVCSSDLSHFYNVEQAKQLDDVIKDDIMTLDPEQLNTDIINKKGEACGFGPILTGMILSKKMGVNQSKIAAYGTSGDVNKDYSNVVGYLSAILYKN